MTSNTPNLKLLKKDPAVDGNDTFNIKTMLNENWDKIDTAVKEVQDELDNVNVPVASTTQPGIVKLTNAIDSSSETQAPTAKALKTVADKSLSKTGGNITGSLNISDPGAVPITIHKPGNKRWVSHLETPTSSDTTGGKLHISPSKTVDSSDWDFDKGVAINADTGAISLKDGVEGGLFVKGRTWVDPKTQYGSSAQLSLTVGDSDSGLNWQSDGVINLVGNGQVAARINGDRFEVKNTDGSWSRVGVQRVAYPSDTLQHQDGSERVATQAMPGVYAMRFRPKAVGEVRIVMDVYQSFASFITTVYATPATILNGLAINERSAMPSSFSTTNLEYPKEGVKRIWATPSGSSPGWYSFDICFHIETLAPLHFFVYSYGNGSNNPLTIGLRNMRIFYDLVEL